MRRRIKFITLTTLPPPPPTPPSPPFFFLSAFFFLPHFFFFPYFFFLSFCLKQLFSLHHRSSAMVPVIPGDEAACSA